MPIADVSSKTLYELISLQGRRAVVTGAARGLGKAIAARLAEAGAAVLLADLDGEAADRAAAALRNGARAGQVVQIIAARADVADGDSIVELAATATKLLGGVDIWINNAGIFPTQPLLEMSDESWDRVLDVNLRGAFIGSREAARCMIAGGRGGVIVNVASVAGFRGVGPGISHYVASKHGVRGLTSQLAVELAPHAIRVLGVAPTIIKTEGVLSAPAMQKDADRKLRTLLGRAGVPDDVARVVLFCVSDLALLMTGSTLIVDAGRLSLG